LPNRKRDSKRPEWLAELLIHPIAPNPHARRRENGYRMEARNTLKSPRFRIGGMGWFRDVTGVNGDDLVAVSADAAKLARVCGWAAMPGVSQTVARKVQEHWQATGAAPILYRDWRQAIVVRQGGRRSFSPANWRLKNSSRNRGARPSPVADVLRVMLPDRAHGKVGKRTIIAKRTVLEKCHSENPPR